MRFHGDASQEMPHFLRETCQQASIPQEWHQLKSGALKPGGAAPSRTSSPPSPSKEEGPTTASVLVEGSLQSLLGL